MTEASAAGRVEIALELAGGRSSSVVVGADALALAADEPVDALIADARALALHGHRLPERWRARVIEVPPGEAAKTWEQLGRVLEALAAAGLDRGARLGLFGGGASTDLGGLAASLYLRGVATVACPTTLLAQVDASVGGKTAVNLAAGKNLAGSFHQPARVLADPVVLDTLPRDELASGLGEVVKTALIGGPELFARVEVLAPRLVAGEAEALAAVVADCVRTKAAVVADDEREAGGRAVLNLGHTVGHAVERVAGYGTVPHGICVAAGVGETLELARRGGLLDDATLPERVGGLLRALGLPGRLAELRRSRELELPAEALRAAMGADKKRAAGRLRFVLPRALGAVAHGLEVEDADLDAILAD